MLVKQLRHYLKEKFKVSFIAEATKRFVLIYLFLGKRQRRFIVYLQILCFINDFFLTALFGSITVLAALLANPELIQSNQYLHALYVFFGFTEKNFLIFSAFAVAGLIITRSLYQLWYSWISQRIIQSINRVCVAQLYYYYVTRDYTDFMSERVDYITNVSGMVSSSINNNMNFVSLISLIFNTAIVVVFLLAYEWLLGSIMFLSITIFYFFALRLVKEKFRRYGARQFAISEERLRLINEGTAGMVDFLMSGKERALGQAMNRKLIEENRISLYSSLTSQIPEACVRIMGALFILAVIAYFVYFREDSNYIGSVAVFLLGGMRLNMAMSNVYHLVLALSQSQHSFYIIMRDLHATKSMRSDLYEDERLLPLENYHGLQLKNVSYHYPQSSSAALSDISFSLPKGKVTVLCGYSGSGKSTLARIIGGLAVPQNGEILLNGEPMRSSRLKRRWQLSIAYVTQKPFFINASLANNVAFAYFEDDVIDYERLHEAVKQAELETFVKSLPQGLDTLIGQSAMRLSGGEGQRILVARALYKRASLFIFDEATSALDKVTERKIMDTILDTSENMSVLVITHEPDIFDASDQVIFLKDGKIAAIGPYRTLLHSHAEFREFAGQ